MSIIFIIVVILLTSAFYIIVGKKLRRFYAVITTSIFLIVLFGISALWWFFPRYIKILNPDKIQVEIGSSSTSDNIKKKEWIDLIENTKFFKGDPIGGYLEGDKLTFIAFLGSGRNIKADNYKTASIGIYIPQNGKYGIADIEGKRYHFNLDAWTQKIQQDMLQ